MDILGNFWSVLAAETVERYHPRADAFSDRVDAIIMLEYTFAQTIGTPWVTQALPVLMRTDNTVDGLTMAVSFGILQRKKLREKSRRYLLIIKCRLEAGG